MQFQTQSQQRTSTDGQKQAVGLMTLVEERMGFIDTQGYHTVLISRNYPYFEVVHLRKYH